MKFQVDALTVEVFPDKARLAAAASAHARSIILGAIGRCGRARIIVGTGNSQSELIDALIREPELDWRAVEAFHLDEYVGISPEHPASFRRWLKTRLTDKVHPATVHYLAGDATDLNAEIARYAGLLAAGPIDLCFVGFGENGHIAFNDPHVAEFADPQPIKRITLDEACRRQQVGEGHFRDLQDVPAEAVTLTCPELMRADHWICCVPDLRKATAVQRAIEGPISPACPASLARTHPSAYLYLDAPAASLLSLEQMRATSIP